MHAVRRDKSLLRPFAVVNFQSNDPDDPVGASGTFQFADKDCWELRVGFVNGRQRVLRASIRRFPLTATAIGPSSVSITTHNPNRSSVFSFELRDTSVQEFNACLDQLPNGAWSEEDERAFQGRRSRTKFSLTFPVVYLGGMSRQPQKESFRQTLSFQPDGIFYVQHFGPGERVCHWADVESVDVDGGPVARQKVASRLALTLAFGVLGAVASTGTKDRTYILLTLRGGDVGIWELDRVSHMEVRAALAPLLHHVGVPLAGGRPVASAQTPAGSAPLIADELAKLGDLRDRGLLSTDEFAAQKARLLSSGTT